MYVPLAILFGFWWKFHQKMYNHFFNKRVKFLYSYLQCLSSYLLLSTNCQNHEKSSKSRKIMKIIKIHITRQYLKIRIVKSRHTYNKFYSPGSESFMEITWKYKIVHPFEVEQFLKTLNHWFEQFRLLVCYFRLSKNDRLF